LTRLLRWRQNQEQVVYHGTGRNSGEKLYNAHIRFYCSFLPAVCSYDQHSMTTNCMNASYDHTEILQLGALPRLLPSIQAKQNFSRNRSANHSVQFRSDTAPACIHTVFTTVNHCWINITGSTTAQLSSNSETGYNPLTVSSARSL
jgi:hypothetical protein